MKPDKEIKAKNVLLFSKRFNEARQVVYFNFNLLYLVESIFVCA